MQGFDAQYFLQREKKSTKIESSIHLDTICEACRGRRVHVDIIVQFC
jgi:hypothetical protein